MIKRKNPVENASVSFLSKCVSGGGDGGESLQHYLSKIIFIPIKH